MFACNGILFNHESPRRGETFVTRKITRGLTRIHHGIQEYLEMGNLDASRDWGHAKDYVEMQWRMLQQKEPKDYVIATGQQYSVREFIEICAIKLGWEGIDWEDKGINEIGKRRDNGKLVIKIDKMHFRPTEVQTLLGNAKKAYSNLGWEPTYNINDLVSEMIESDMKIALKEK